MLTSSSPSCSPRYPIAVCSSSLLICKAGADKFMTISNTLGLRKRISRSACACDPKLSLQVMFETSHLLRSKLRPHQAVVVDVQHVHLLADAAVHGVQLALDALQDGLHVGLQPLVAHHLVQLAGALHLPRGRRSLLRIATRHQTYPTTATPHPSSVATGGWSMLLQRCQRREFVSL